MNEIQEAIMMELADSELYEREAALFRSKLIDGERIGRIFKRFAAEERVHLEALRTVATSRDLSIGSPGKSPVSSSLRETLRQHADRELKAIRIYESLLKGPLAPMEALLVKGILADEKEHLQALLHYLKGID
jgi:rubrerythrin